MDGVLGLSPADTLGFQSYGEYLVQANLTSLNTLSIYNDPVSGNQTYLFGTFNTSAPSTSFYDVFDSNSGYNLW